MARTPQTRCPRLDLGRNSGTGGSRRAWAREHADAYAVRLAKLATGEQTMKLRGRDVLLPTTHVGSYPRPVYLQGKVFDVGVDAMEFPSFHTRELYRAAVAGVIRDQERIG